MSIILAAALCSGPACCVVYGVPAVCRSAIVEREAVAIVLRHCRRAEHHAVNDLVFSFQMNRGPYEDASELARDVRAQMICGK